MKFLTDKGRDILERSRQGHEEGKVEYSLYREIEQQLLDSYEVNIDHFDKQLTKRGA